MAELRDADWAALVERSPLTGDTANVFAVDSARRWTHLRLSIYPDGGVARLRVHGEVVAHARAVAALGTVDLAALELLGGRVTGCSNLFYGAPDRLIAPGLARSMGEGWETARRRDDGNDWVVVRLATRGTLRVVDLDTTWFLGNAPAAASLSTYDGSNRSDDSAGPADPADWTPLLVRASLQPDTPHRIVLPVLGAGDPRPPRRLPRRRDGPAAALGYPDRGRVRGTRGPLGRDRRMTRATR